MHINKIKQEINHIKYFLKSDIEDYLNKTGAGYFAILLLVFTLVNYLAALWSGKSSFNDKETIDFIKKYFIPKYRRFPGIVYIIYRHGTVHERMPKIIQLRKRGRIISWYISKNSSTQHLQLAIVKKSNGKKSPVIYFSIKSLVLDLTTAINYYEKELFENTTTGAKLRKNFADALKVMRNPKNEDCLLKKYSYLDQKEFSNLREDIKNSSVVIKGP